MKYKIPIQIIELESDNFHVIVKASFNDNSTGNWVIDTGASKSVFDINLTDLFKTLDGESDEIHSAGIKDEPIKTSIGYLKPLSLGAFNLNSFKVALLDLNHINELYSKSTQLKICGLLGGDFLMKFNAVIDYKRKRLILNQ